MNSSSILVSGSCNRSITIVKNSLQKQRWPPPDSRGQVVNRSPICIRQTRRILDCSMAGSRLEKLGTVFTRTRDLMRAGIIKEKEKPIWYDVYAAFPPKREPTIEKPVKRQRKLPDPIPAIFYNEDIIRAKFYETYGNAGIFHLYRKNYRSVCQSFVDTYMELQKAGEISEDKLFEETSKALLAKGISLRRTAATRIPNLQMTENQPESKVNSTTEETKLSDETDGQPATL